MGTNASLRYALVAAAEGALERTPALAGRAWALNALTLVMRLANNVYGASLWVEMLQQRGLSP